MPPKCSVIIPTYNYASYISQAIDSVQNSSFPKQEVEIIVIDDGSSDNTKEVVSRYGSSVRYLHQDNKGKAAATRLGIESAHGEIIFNLDADDVFLPTKIETVVGIFNDLPKVVHVGHPAIIWSETPPSKIPENIPEELLNGVWSGEALLMEFYQRNIMFGGGSTFAARREVLLELDIPDDVDMYIDEFLLVFTLAKGQSVLTSKPLSQWRVHAQNYSNENAPGEQKAERSEKSYLAVTEAVQESSLSDEIKALSEIKSRTSQLAALEKKGEKTFSDIAELWKFLLDQSPNLPSGLWKTVQAYYVMNRSLPLWLMNALRKMKKTH